MNRHAFEKRGKREMRRHLLWAFLGLAALLTVLLLHLKSTSLPGHILEPLPSPDGRRIAFVAVFPRDLSPVLEQLANGFRFYPSRISARLWVLERKSGSVMRSGFEVFNGVEVMTWSPESSQIVFVSGSNDRFLGLDRYDVAGASVASLDSKSWYSAPKYSPRGSYLGYVRTSRVSVPGRVELIVEDLSTGTQTVISSNVLPYQWQWTGDGSDIVFIEEGGAKIMEYRTADGTARVLHSVSDPGTESVGHLVSSPDGSTIGFYEYGSGWFIELDRESRKCRHLFQCRHPNLNFAWSPSGICYLDRTCGGPLDYGKLVVYDTEARSERTIATGRFRSPRWMSPREILAVKHPVELWLFNVVSGEAEVIFPPPR